MKQLLIGTTEYIALPRVGEGLFPAKIDTGADSSAIWASGIEQSNGTLSYVFFAPGSMYYNGVRHRTKRFKITSVKNSFGHEETRYKIRLKVMVGDKAIIRWFSLADRSNNTYPILLGKNFLKDNFVVDVAKSNVHGSSENQRVLVITAKPDEMGAFLADVRKHNDEKVDYVTASFDSLLFDIDGHITSVINTADDDTDLAQYSLVYVKSHWNYPEQAAALAEYLTYKNRVFLDKEIGTYTSRSKLSEAMRLVTHDILVPPTLAGFPALLGERLEMIKEQIGFPLVFKAAAADRGRDNYLVPDEKVFTALIAEAKAHAIYLVQKYIPNDGFYRINVFGKDAVLAVYRSAHPHENPLKQHLNKPGGGENATKVELADVPAELNELAVRGAMCLNRQIAGVDALKHKETGDWYVLEVNNSPQLRSGAYLDDKEVEFAKFIDKELRR